MLVLDLLKAYLPTLVVLRTMGTVPALVALSLSATWLPLGLRVRLRQLTPVVLALTAALLLVRGFAPAHGVSHPRHAAGAVDHR